MLPDKPEKEYCEESVTAYDLIRREVKFGSTVVINFICKKCGWECEEYPENTGAFKHTRPFVNNVEKVAAQTELTSPRDFIEILVEPNRGMKDWVTEYFNRRHIIRIYPRTIIKMGVPDHETGWFIGYGSASYDELRIHPDSVGDLLKFIKEG